MLIISLQPEYDHHGYNRTVLFDRQMCPKVPKSEEKKTEIQNFRTIFLSVEKKIKIGMSAERKYKK